MKEIISKILKECEKHKDMLLWQKEKLRSIFPLDTKKLSEIEIETKSLLDATIFRFAKLQDTISQKLLKNILILLEEDTESLAFIDILNKLEKLKVIPDAEKWRELRKMRNIIVHEYEENPEMIVEELNLFYSSIDYLIGTYEVIKEYLDKKFGIKIN